MSELRRAMMAKKLGGGLPPGVVLYDKLIPKDYTNQNVFIDLNETFGNNIIKLYGSIRTSVRLHALRVNANDPTYNKNALFSLNGNYPRINNGVVTANQGGYYYGSFTYAEWNATTAKALRANDTYYEVEQARVALNYNLQIGTAYNYFSRLEIYSANGTLIAEYYPCTKNDVVGLFDVVNNAFCSNSDTNDNWSVAND